MIFKTKIFKLYIFMMNWITTQTNVFLIIAQKMKSLNYYILFARHHIMTYFRGKPVVNLVSCSQNTEN